MPYEHILVAADAGLATVTMNRPERRNALSEAHMVELTEALARAASRGSLASKALGKRAFYDTIDLDVEAAYAHACEVMASSALTPDGREAMLSFLEKRPGVFPPRR